MANPAKNAIKRRNRRDGDHGNPGTCFAGQSDVVLAYIGRCYN